MRVYAYVRYMYMYMYIQGYIYESLPVGIVIQSPVQLLVSSECTIPTLPLAWIQFIQIPIYIPFLPPCAEIYPLMRLLNPFTTTPLSFNLTN